MSGEVLTPERADEIIAEAQRMASADGGDPLEAMVFTALGVVSVCWETPEGAGVFDSTSAKAIGDALCTRLKLGANV